MSREESRLGWRNVKGHPVEAELESGGGELIVVDGLEDIAVGEMLVGGRPVAIFVR